MHHEIHVQQHAEFSFDDPFFLHSAFDGAVPNGGPAERCHGNVLICLREGQCCRLFSFFLMLGIGCLPNHAMLGMLFAINLGVFLEHQQICMCGMQTCFLGNLSVTSSDHM